MKSILFIFFLFSNISFCQEKIVVDKESKKGIEYATILFYKNNKFISGTYSDENGLFDLSQNIDKITISCIGYNNISIIEINQNTKFELEKKTYVLDEVLISNKKYSISNLNEKKSNNVGLAKGIEVGSFINNNLEKELKIKTVKFKVNKIKEDINYRIHFYSCKLNSYVPYEELTKNNIIQILKKDSKGLIEVNIENENIIIPKEGIYITLECLDGKEAPVNKYVLSKKESIFSIEAHKSYLFYYITKNTIQGVGWLNYNEWLPKNYKMTFNIDYNLNLLYVPSFDLELIKIN